MQQTPPLDETVNALLNLLTHEKAQLLAGNYDDLGDLNASKNYLSATLTKCFEASHSDVLHAHKDDIERIMQLSRENTKLLHAAKSGVSSAITRIKSLLEREKTVGTYQVDGYKLQTHNSGVTCEKRA